MNSEPGSSPKADGGDLPTSPEAQQADSPGGVAPLMSGLKDWLKTTIKGRGETARDTLEELIEERDEASIPMDDHERLLIGNVLHLRDVTASDVMIPRAQVIAVETGTPLKEVTRLMAKTGHSRLPVYRKTLDDVAGMVHIKDLLGALGRGRATKIAPFVRPLLFVSPAMRVFDLLLEMRQKRNHMALVVDEYGGIDGLVTIEDLVEQIVGEIEDEHDTEDVPPMTAEPDGTVIADARTEIEDLTTVIGEVLTADESEDTDTLGGLVFHVADRVPARGEIIEHSSGIEFEILEADPRRIKKVRLRRLPKGAAKKAGDAG